MLKKTDYKLVYTDIPAWTFIFVLGPLFYVALSMFNLVSFNLVYLIIGALFGTVIAFAVRYCKVIFDGRNKTIYWSKFGLFKREVGRCLFEQVKELSVESVKDDESADGQKYRLVLRLDNADVSLTDQYQSDIDSIKFKAEQISEFTGIKIGQKMLSWKESNVERIGRND